MKVRRWLVPAALWLGGALLLGVLAALRVVNDGKTELRASQASSAAGDADGAIVHARRAAMSYLPFAPHVAAAYRQLRDIAVESEAKGDVDVAIFAWRSIRAAAIGSRSWFSPRFRERAIADAAIARLVAGAHPSSVSSRPDRAPDQADRGRHFTAVDLPPKVGLSALLLAGVALWIAGGVRLSTRGWDREGRLKSIEVRKAAWLAAAGAMAWLAGLWMS